MKVALSLLLFFAIVSGGLAHAYGEKGVIISVNENLTMNVVLMDGSLERISLYGLYVPSTKYAEVKAFLQHSLQGQTVHYFQKGHDGYTETTLAHILKEGKSVQYQLAANGNACGNSSSNCPLGMMLSRISPDHILLSSVQ